jgi:hypothetical protein
MENLRAWFDREIPYILAAVAAIMGMAGIVSVLIFNGIFNLHTLTVTEILIMSLFLCLCSTLILMFETVLKEIHKLAKE